MTSKVHIARTATPRQRDDGAKDERFSGTLSVRALKRVRKGDVVAFDVDVVRLLGA